MSKKSQEQIAHEKANPQESEKKDYSNEIEIIKVYNRRRQAGAERSAGKIENSPYLTAEERGLVREAIDLSKKDLEQLNREIEELNRAIGSGEIFNRYGSISKAGKGFEKFDYSDPQAWAEREVEKRYEEIHQREINAREAVKPSFEEIMMKGPDQMGVENVEHYYGEDGSEGKIRAHGKIEGEGPNQEMNLAKEQAPHDNLTQKAEQPESEDNNVIRSDAQPAQSDDANVSDIISPKVEKNSDYRGNSIDTQIVSSAHNNESDEEISDTADKNTMEGVAELQKPGTSNAAEASNEKGEPAKSARDEIVNKDTEFDEEQFSRLKQEGQKPAKGTEIVNPDAEYDEEELEKVRSEITKRSRETEESASVNIDVEFDQEEFERMKKKAGSRQSMTEQERADIAEKFGQEFRIDRQVLENLRIDSGARGEQPAYFKDLTYGQQMLVLENLRQQALSRVQEEALLRTRHETAKAGFFKRAWLNITRKYQGAKLEKEVANAMQTGGMDTHSALIKELARQVRDQGKDVVMSQDGKFKIQFIENDAYPGATEQQKNIISNFNETATEFSKVPYEWSLATAEKDQQKRFAAAKKSFDRSRNEALAVLKELDSDNAGDNSQEGKKPEAELDAFLKMNGIENEIRIQQFLKAHPEVKEELERVRKTPAWRRVFSIAKERALYAGSSFALRSASATLLGAAGLPLAAAALGGYMRLKRARADLNEKEQRSRKGGGKDLRYRTIGNDEWESDVAFIRKENTTKENAPLEKIDLVKLKLARPYENENARDVEDSSYYAETIDSLIKIIADNESRLGAPRKKDVVRMQEAVVSLKFHIQDAQRMIDAGAIDFGVEGDRQKNQYELMQAMSRGLVFLAQNERGGSVTLDNKDLHELGALGEKWGADKEYVEHVKAINKLLKKQEKELANARRKDLAIKFAKGAVLGAGFGAAGRLAGIFYRHGFNSDKVWDAIKNPAEAEYLKKAGKHILQVEKDNIDALTSAPAASGASQRSAGAPKPGSVGSQAPGALGGQSKDFKIPGGPVSGGIDASTSGPGRRSGYTGFEKEIRESYNKTAPKVSPGTTQFENEIRDSSEALRMAGKQVASEEDIKGPLGIQNKYQQGGPRLGGHDLNKQPHIREQLPGYESPEDYGGEPVASHETAPGYGTPSEQGAVLRNTAGMRYWDFYRTFKSDPSRAGWKMVNISPQEYGVVDAGGKHVGVFKSGEGFYGGREWELPSVGKAIEAAPAFNQKFLELATIRKGDGIEHVLRRQLEADPQYYGFQGDTADLKAVHEWSGSEAHRIAENSGYAGKNSEVRIGSKGIGRVAYYIDYDDGKAVVREIDANTVQSGRPADIEEHAIADSPRNAHLETRGEMEDYEYEQRKAHKPRMIRKTHTAKPMAHELPGRGVASEAGSESELVQKPIAKPSRVAGRHKALPGSGVTQEDISGKTSSAKSIRQAKIGPGPAVSPNELQQSDGKTGMPSGVRVVSKEDFLNNARKADAGQKIADISEKKSGGKATGVKIVSKNEFESGASKIKTISREQFEAISAGKATNIEKLSGNKFVDSVKTDILSDQDKALLARVINENKYARFFEGAVMPPRASITALEGAGIIQFEDPDNIYNISRMEIDLNKRVFKIWPSSQEDPVIIKIRSKGLNNIIKEFGKHVQRIYNSEFNKNIRS